MIEYVRSSKCIEKFTVCTLKPQCMSIFFGGKVRYIWLFPAIVLFTKNDSHIDLYVKTPLRLWIVGSVGIFSSACSRSCRKRMGRTCSGSTSQKRNCNRRIHWPVPSFPDQRMSGWWQLKYINIYIYLSFSPRIRQVTTEMGCWPLRVNKNS